MSSCSNRDAVLAIRVGTDRHPPRSSWLGGQQNGEEEKDGEEGGEEKGQEALLIFLLDLRLSTF